MKLVAEAGKNRLNFEILERDGKLLLRFGGRAITLELDEGRRSVRMATILRPRSGQAGRRTVRFGWKRLGQDLEILLRGKRYLFRVEDARVRKTLARAQRETAREGSVPIRAPIPGLVVAVHAKPGERVSTGSPLVVLQAMKLENEIASPVDALIEEVLVEKGQAVEKDQTLVRLSQG